MSHLMIKSPYVNEFTDLYLKFYSYVKYHHILFETGIIRKGIRGGGDTGGMASGSRMRDK